MYKNYDFYVSGYICDTNFDFICGKFYTQLYIYRSGIIRQVTS